MLGHEFPWAAVQMPVTVMDPHYKSFIRGVLPEAQRRGIGVIGMKALGGRTQFLTGAGLSAAECLRFAMSQPISTLVSGMTTTEMVDHNSALASDFTPMSEAEQEALLRRVRPVAADGRLEWYKSTQAFDAPPHRHQHGFPPADELPVMVGDTRSA
jgi:predicted aldo/keto reductase-like oxidoreductase